MRCIIAVFLLCLLPVLGRAAVAPEWYAAASLIIPGTSQLIFDEKAAAAAHFGVYVASGSIAAELSLRDDFIEADDRYDEDNLVIYMNDTTYDATLANRVMLNTMLFSSYDAYRLARMRDPAPRRTPAPTETFRDLALAPFNPDYLLRPTTLIPLIVPVAMLIDPPAERWVTVTDDSIDRGYMMRGNLLRYGSVAVGEEAFFRGVVNTSAVEHTGSEWWGLAASSVIFGLAHNGEGGSAGIGTASAYGAYLGWLQIRNDYTIGQSVALHFWWDFLIGISMLSRLDELPADERADRENEVVFPVATFSLPLR